MRPVLPTRVILVALLTHGPATAALELRTECDVSVDEHPAIETYLAERYEAPAT